MAVRHVAGIESESRLRSRWGFESSSKVWMVIGGSAEQSEKSSSLPKKLVRTRKEDRHEVQELVGSPVEHCREIVGSSPKET